MVAGQELVNIELAGGGGQAQRPSCKTLSDPMLCSTCNASNPSRKSSLNCRSLVNLVLGGHRVLWDGSGFCATLLYCFGCGTSILHGHSVASKWLLPLRARYTPHPDASRSDSLAVQPGPTSCRPAPEPCIQAQWAQWGTVFIAGLRTTWDRAHGTPRPPPKTPRRRCP